MAQRAVFITGAASGIGAAVAQRFADQGWYVGLYDIDTEKLKERKANLGTGAVCSRAVDVTDPDDVQQAVNQFSSHTGGRMDVLFNGAGVASMGPFSEVDVEEHRQVMDVNVNGTMICAKQAFPLLRDTEEARVINMASASATYGTPGLASYSASKGAVQRLTEALNLEWAEHDIYVCDIMPTYVNTPMIQNAARTETMDSVSANLEPEDVAKIVHRASYGSHSRVHWSLGGGWAHRLSGVLPASINRFLTRRMTGY